MLAVDNAANSATRRALIEKRGDRWQLVDAADPAATPLGHLLIRMAEAMGWTDGGTFQVSVDLMGILKLGYRQRGET